MERRGAAYGKVCKRPDPGASGLRQSENAVDDKLNVPGIDGAVTVDVGVQ